MLLSVWLLDMKDVCRNANVFLQTFEYHWLTEEWMNKSVDVVTYFNVDWISHYNQKIIFSSFADETTLRLVFFAFNLCSLLTSNTHDNKMHIEGIVLCAISETIRGFFCKYIGLYNKDFDIK